MIQCEHCGKWKLKKDLRTIKYDEGRIIVCKEHIENEEFKWCDKCEQYHIAKYITEKESTNEKVCVSCTRDYER
jgi:hypothetical protein